MLMEQSRSLSEVTEEEEYLDVWTKLLLFHSFEPFHAQFQESLPLRMTSKTPIVWLKQVRWCPLCKSGD